MSALVTTGSVEFEVLCRQTQPGDTVAVCGASPALGAWDPKRSTRLRTSTSTFPKWSSEPIQIEQGTAYKFIILEPNGRTRWEGQENRVLPGDIASGSCILITAEFECQGATLETRAKEVCDSSAGASDLDTCEVRRVFDMLDIEQKGRINRDDLMRGIREFADVARFFGLPQSLQQEHGSRDAFEAFFQSLAASGSCEEVTWWDFYNFHTGFDPILPSYANGSRLASLRIRMENMRRRMPTWTEDAYIKTVDGDTDGDASVETASPAIPLTEHLTQAETQEKNGTAARGEPSGLLTPPMRRIRTPEAPLLEKDPKGSCLCLGAMVRSIRAKRFAPAAGEAKDRKALASTDRDGTSSTSSTAHRFGTLLGA